jgi:hypothetical protein
VEPRESPRRATWQLVFHIGWSKSVALSHLPEHGERPRCVVIAHLYSWKKGRQLRCAVSVSASEEGWTAIACYPWSPLIP